MNQINLIGYLGKDWELINSTNGGVVAKNSLAITKTTKKGNEVIKHTDWIPLVAFGKRAEVLNQYTRKGERLCVTGEIYTSQYTKDGENRTNWQIIINAFFFLSNKNEKEQAEAEKAEAQQEPIVSINEEDIKAEAERAQAHINEEDIPF